MIQSEWRGSNRLTGWSAPVRISGTLGQNGTDAPKYRGAVSNGNADTSNNGYVSTNHGLSLEMRHEDYVMYLGNPTQSSNPQWRTGYIYQWNANSLRWYECARPTSIDTSTASMYWDAMNDLTANAPEMYVSTGFIRSLIADSAFIKYLYAQQIIIQSDESGGFIQSANYVAGQSGFIIRWNGDVEIADGIIRGGINIGYAFDENGDIKPSRNNGGLYIDKTGLSAVKILGPRLIGYTQVESDGYNNVRPFIQFNNAIKSVCNGNKFSYTKIGDITKTNNVLNGYNIIRGTMTLSALSAIFYEKFGGDTVAIFGTVSTIQNNLGEPTPYTAHITFAFISYTGNNFHTYYTLGGSLSNGSLAEIALNTSVNAYVNLICI